MIVADNTLISYFTIQGEYTESAVAVRKKDPTWMAPPLWRSEFLNVLWLHVTRGDFGLGLAYQHLDMAEDLIADRTAAVAFPEVLRLATDAGCSTYDCQYVALAQSESVLLVTHDSEVLDAFPETACRPELFLQR